MLMYSDVRPQFRKVSQNAPVFVLLADALTPYTILASKRGRHVVKNASSLHVATVTLYGTELLVQEASNVRVQTVGQRVAVIVPRVVVGGERRQFGMCLLRKLLIRDVRMFNVGENVGRHIYPFYVRKFCKRCPEASVLLNKTKQIRTAERLRYADKTWSHNCQLVHASTTVTVGNYIAECYILFINLSTMVINCDTYRWITFNVLVTLGLCQLTSILEVLGLLGRFFHFTSLHVSVDLYCFHATAYKSLQQCTFYIYIYILYYIILSLAAIKIKSSDNWTFLF